MPEFERSRLIQAAPEDVFAFVADVQNLPNYVATVRSVEVPAAGRVRVRGEARGRRFADDGYLKIDPNRRRLEWGADEADYAGWLTVGPAVDGAARVVVRLSFYGASDELREIQASADAERPIEDGLEAALDSLKNLIEGTGGKQPPPVDTGMTAEAHGT